MNPGEQSPMDTFTPNRNILYVDDEDHLLAAFQSLLRKEDISTFVLNDSTRIDEMLRDVGPFALVVSDQRMPGTDGVTVLQTVRQVHPETIRILMTGYADFDATLRAVNNGGISKYVSKPWNDEELRAIVRESVNRYNLVKENTYLVERLRAKNLQLEQVLDGTVAQTARILSDMVGYINPQIGAYVDRIKRLGLAALSLMPEVEPQERWDISRALDLFCLGLAVLPAWVQVSLNKHGLSALDRFPVATNHNLLAAGLLKDIPQFGGVARIVQFQERDFDGSGEPSGEQARGKDIPLGARLLHILIDLEKQSSANFKGREVLERMVNKRAKYDTELISRMLGFEKTGRTSVRQASLAVNDLKPGMVLLDEVVTQSGHCLLKPASSLTETSISILQQWDTRDPIVGPVRVYVDG
jgi:response regulator RpfG family c-di-GMP phosphodiesterase